jgi:hypothetical protein
LKWRFDFGKIIPPHRNGRTPMNSRVIRLVGVGLLLLLLVSCGEDEGPRISMIHGSVQADGQAAAGAVIYLAEAVGVPPDLPSAVLSWQDSTIADPRGLYHFTDLEPGIYHVYAGRRAVRAEKRSEATASFSEVSPLSDGLTITDGSSVRTADLSLRPLTCAGSLGGRVVLEPDGPVAGAIVTVRRLEGFLWHWIADTASDEEGHYLFPLPLCTGTYEVTASYELNGFPVVGRICDVWHDGMANEVLPDLYLAQTLVRKPAIYLYPEQTTRFTVELRLAPDVRLTASEPPYGEGWQVEVAPGGLIEGERRYLFYELATARTPALEHGWCLPRADLVVGLSAILSELGLNEAESSDFLEYWLPVLRGHSWWLVCPLVDTELEPWAGLAVTPRPDSARRVWLCFQGRPGQVELPEPSIPPFARTGTSLLEWGGMIVGAAPGARIGP